jgi:hypothetical protein
LVGIDIVFARMNLKLGLSDGAFMAIIPVKRSIVG